MMMRVLPFLLNRTALALAMMVWLTTTSGNAQTTGDDERTSITPTRLTLAASGDFRLVIRPTMFELDFVALSIVEEAMTTAILLSTNTSLVDVNININQMNWLSSANENDDELVDGTVNALGVNNIPTTVMRFFAVGTFLSNPGGMGSLAAVKRLDDIIANAFSQDNSIAFVQLLRNSGEFLLEGVQDAVAIRTNSNPSAPQNPTTVGSDEEEPEEGGSGLSTLDIVLIIIAVAVLCIVLVFGYAHFLDRGYRRNQRMQSLSSPRRRRTRETGNGYFPRDEKDDEGKKDKGAASVAESKSDESSKTSVVNNRQPTQERPSSNTSSSVLTSSEDHTFITNFSLPPSPTDINTHLNSRKSRYSSKIRTSIEHCDSKSLPTPTTGIKLLTSTSSVHSLDDKSECKSTGALSINALSTALSSDFGPINWFRTAASKGLSSVIPSTDAVDNIQEEDEEEEGASRASKNSTTSSSSSWSDVFQVGNVKPNVPPPAGSVNNTSDTVSKASSVVTEWMKTIQVISSTDSKTGSEITCKGSSSEQSSTAANSSTEAPTVEEEEAEEDIESLEHSMANSKSMSGLGEEESLIEC